MDFIDVGRWIQAGNYISSSPKILPHQTTVSRACSSVMVGNSEVIESGCHHSGSRIRNMGRSLFPIIPNKKNQRDIQDDMQPERPESIHPIQEIQNGDCELGDHPDSPRGLHVHNRLAGCLLSRTNTSSIPKISQGCGPQPRRHHKSFPVQGTSLRNILSSQDILEDYHRNSCLLKNKKDNHNPISGRSTNRGKIRTRANTSQRFHNYHPQTVGLDHKLGKIKSESQQGYYVPGDFSKFITPDVLPSSGKSIKTLSRSRIISEQSQLFHKRCDEVIRPTDGMYPSSTVESVSYPQITKLAPISMGQRSDSSRLEDRDPCRGQRSLSLVDTSREPTKRDSLAPMALVVTPDRCKPVWMGGKFRRIPSSREMASIHTKTFFQLPGVESSVGSHESQRRFNEIPSFKNILRQCHHSGISTPPGGHKEFGSSSSIRKDLQLVRTEHIIPICSPSERRRKHGSRLPKQEDHQPERMVPEQRDLQTSNPKMGCSKNRSIRNPHKCEDKVFLLARQFNTYEPTRCVQTSLEGGTDVCLPTNTSNLQSDSEDPKREGKSNPRSALLAKEGMVSITQEAISGRAYSPPSSCGPTIPGTTSASKSPGSPIISMDPERELLKTKGLSHKVISTLKASRKPVTQAIYFRIWNKFVTFCGPEIPNQNSPNISQVLDFLQAGFDKGLKTSSLKVQISALSAFFDSPLADHQWVSSSFHLSQEIILPTFCRNPKTPKEEEWHSLDVRRILLFYLETTRQWRRDSNILLQFSGKNKGTRASKSTIARWIKTVIKNAYVAQNMSIPETIRAHSTRAMATSWAEKRGASINEICRAATWSSQMTFVKHYRLDLQSTKELAFGRKVLQAVVPP
ncbi:uncharacterized protein [Engystomops pustulosus]|uniref:uncharacterized protein n=1 Tax=Engystomops pustulosus TaxID=76066 RepID=UPI003AFA6B51